MISISHPQWDPPLTLNNRLGAMYTSKSQKSRVLTELWVEDNMYCLVCGNCSVSKYPANMPVADFLRPSCWTVDELKENPHILEMKKITLVEEKIRQQLQMLRDRGSIQFISRGTYCKSPTH